MRADQRSMARALLGAAGLALLACTAAGAQDMPISQVVLDGEPWRPLADGPARGLAADRQGRLYASHPDRDHVRRLDLDGRSERVAGGEIGLRGLALGPDGRIFACQPGRNRILAIDEEGRATTAAEGVAADDLVVARSGAIYAAAAEARPIVRIEPEGKPRPVGGEPSSSGHAGLAFWADGGTLVAGAAGGKVLWTFRIGADGALDAREPYYPLRTRRGQPDARVAALALDADGRLYAAAADGVQVFDPTGRLSGVLPPPERSPVAALAFAGPERDRLVISCGGKLYVRKVRPRGATSK